MTMLIQSLVSFLLGPLVAILGGRLPSMLPVIDGFVLISLSGLVMLEVIPHAMEEIGLWALGLAMAGLLVPSFVEKSRFRIADQAHDMALIFGIVAILLHSMVDGLALAISVAEGNAEAFGSAVILHRLLEGMAVWWLLRPTHGKRLAMATIFAGVLLNLAGWFGGQQLQSLVSSFPSSAVMALLGGALLHVIIHAPDQKSVGVKRAARLSATGALLGLLFLYRFVLQDSVHLDNHAIHSGVGDFLDRFIALARASAWPLLLAYTVAGLIHALLPKATIQWMARGSNLQQSLRGMLFGLPLPICSCGVLPLYRSLVEKGVPTAAAVTLLVATPELGIDAVILSFTMVDGPFAIARVVTAAILAISVGMLSLRFIRPIQVKPDQLKSTEPHKPITERIVDGLKVGLCDLVDNTAPWIVLGLSLAAALSPLVEDGSFLANIPDWLEVPAFALLGLPIYVCASGATPLAAVLIAGGASPGAALAFLLTGPATNATTFGILGDLHGRRAAILFAICIGIGAIGCGYAVDAILDGVTVGVAEHIHLDHPSHSGEEGSFGSAELFLGLLALLFLMSIFRKGPRAFLNQVFGNPAESPESTDSSCCSSEGEEAQPAPGGS